MRKIVLACTVLLLSACGGGAGLKAPTNPDQFGAAIEITARNVHDTLATLANAELASRAACESGQAAVCRAYGYYLTRERAEALLGYVSSVTKVARLAQDNVGQPCLPEAKELQVLGLKGCVDSLTALRVALAGVTALNNRLLKEAP